MIVLSESIHKAWKEQKVFTAVFLDVAGAFNNVHHKRLIHNLKMRRIPLCLVKWLESFLNGRTTRLQFNGKTSDTISINAGIPQGSPLSPLLYMYYNADLLTVSARPNDVALGFIDDIVYGTAGNTDKGNVTKLKHMLREAEAWRTQHGAQFEQSKYVLVHFTQNYRKPTNACLTIDGTRIEPSDEARYLGVVFDKGLRFKAHLQHAIKKGTSAALALGSIGKATWGAAYKHIRQLFLTVVAARMDYAAIIWHKPKANGSTAASAPVRKFTTVQRLGMKATLGCFKTTPTAAMERESGLQPAWIRLQTKALSAAARMQSLALNHPVSALISQSIQATGAPTKPTHCSNLENLAHEYREFMASTVKRTKPFDMPPWAEPTIQTEEPTQQGTTKKAQQQRAEKLAKDMWDKSWNEGNPTTAIHLRRISREPGTKEGPELYGGIENRAAAALLAQLRTGHCGLNHYLWRFKRAEKAECEKCGYEKETVEHFLLECPSFWEERQELRRRVGTGEMRTAVLLGNKNVVNATLDYIFKTGRLKKVTG